jgi:hypothetical protein
MAVKRVSEKPPSNVKEPGCEGGQESVETGYEEVLGAIALPFDEVLDERDGQPGHHCHHHRHQAGARAGCLGRYKDPARRHGFPTTFGLAMGTLRV